MLIVTVALLLAGCAGKQETSGDLPEITPTLTIDFSDVVGEIKPVNGINNGPKVHAVREGTKLEWSLDATEYYHQCRIPFVRTHDTEFPDGSDAFIDVHCIFPDEQRDPEDPKAYHFTETDAYIKNIKDSGAEVYYRLGESIAISVQEAKHQYPPQDYEKWAVVCAHIIAHYNQGWNNGFHYNIRYWQIWNEPDQKRQWNADIKEYYELYRITSRYLKGQFPDILIGASAEASVTDDNLQELLDGIRIDGEETPLDFLGWHLYMDEPSIIEYRANLVRKVLDRNGYDETQTFLDEWNYVNDWDNLQTTWDAIRDPSIAAFYGACMMAIQNASVDGAMYYDGSFTTDERALWCGLYDENGDLLPGYSAFCAFGKLADLKDQVSVSTESDPSEKGIYACAAAGRMEQGVLIANIGNRTARFQVKAVSAYPNAEIIRYSAEDPTGVQEAWHDNAEKTILEMKSGELLYIRYYKN